MTSPMQMSAEACASTFSQRALPLELLVGENRQGQWVVRDRRARCGGLFSSRTEALRFAFRERGEGAGAVILVPEYLELFEASPDRAPVRNSSVKPAAIEQLLQEV